VIHQPVGPNSADCLFLFLGFLGFAFWSVLVCHDFSLFELPWRSTLLRGGGADSGNTTDLPITVGTSVTVV
jgi:hypothetical protein